MSIRFKRGNCRHCGLSLENKKYSSIFCNLACFNAHPKSDEDRRKKSEAFKRNFGFKDKHPAWKGGRFLSNGKDGYWLVYHPNYHRQQKNVYAYEHDLVMEKKIGRPLVRKEVVHHINCDPTDNRPENLQLFSGAGEHLNHHLELGGKRLEISRRGGIQSGISRRKLVAR
jgi:hypothetical protein